VRVLNFAKRSPKRDPESNAKIGVLAAIGEIGGKDKGGRIVQFNVAPQTTAAKESVTVGRVNKILVLWMFKRGG